MNDMESRIMAAKLFITRQGIDESAAFIAHQSVALEGLTKNNSALGEAYRAALQSKEAPASSGATPPPPTTDFTAALAFIEDVATHDLGHPDCGVGCLQDIVLRAQRLNAGNIK